MKIKLFFVWLIPFIFFLLVPKVFAQEKIESFDVSIIAHKDGTMTIKEKIDYDFGSENRHGIFRTLPLVSEVGPLYRIIVVDFLDIKRDGSNENFEVDKQSKNIEVKIGDPDKTITGLHNYIIVYTVENGIGSNYENHDEIYWNVTGNSWQIPIEKASYKIETDFGVDPLESICFTGPAASRLQNCLVEDKFISTTQRLEPYQGLTTVTKFPVNTFPKSILKKSEPFLDPDFITLLKIYIPILISLNLLLAPFLLFRYFKNKPKQRFGSPAVNFDIPKDGTGKILPPAEAGIIDNHKLERDDVVATIFDLAIKKYIKIEEVKKIKTLRPDEIDYEIVRLKNNGQVSEFEKKLLDRLFQSGERVSLKSLKSDFYLTFSKLENEIFDSLQEKGFYEKNPKNQMTGLLVLGILTLVSGNLLLGSVLIFLSRKLTGRTSLGDKIDWEVDGLKIFLKAMSRHHKFQSKNLITVEKYIPYAIALGLQDEFMDQLKIMNPDYKPSWYSGSHSFYHVYPGMYTNFSLGMTTAAPSSSSGFSGGSSGGGGGGGGGGSW